MGHLFTTGWYFLSHSGLISMKVAGHLQHCQKTCGGMEIPCLVTFTYSRKVALDHLKKHLLMKAV